MKNLILIIPILFSLSLYAQTYSPADSLALLKIDAECDILDSLNWNREPNPLNWDGITWDSVIPKRVTKIENEWGTLSGVLDLTPFDSLIWLNCNNNDVDSLVLDNLSKLQGLKCRSNNLSYLDISTLGSLRYLNVNGNRINELNISDTNNCFLLQLACRGNDISYLKLSVLSRLKSLDIAGNPLNIDTLSFPFNDSLVMLSCADLGLNYLDVSNLSLLKELYCYENNLKELNLKNQKKLTVLMCYYNFLTELDLSANPFLYILSCSLNMLTMLDISLQYNVTIFDCAFNKLTQLKLGKHRSIQTFDCSDNQLTEIDFSGVGRLMGCEVKNNKLPFTSLATGLHSESLFYPSVQDSLFEPETYKYNITLDYSAEANINGTVTQFVFYKNGEVLETNNTGMLNTNGSGVYFCEMTNDLFPDFILTTSSVTITGGVGIVTNLSCNAFKVYPNPTNGLFTIENANLEQGNYNLTLYNSMGKVVYSEEIVFQENIRVNLSGLPKGLYFVEFENCIGKFYEKIMLRD